MPSPPLPENLHNVITLVRAINSNPLHGRSADIEKALDDLRRAIAAELLRAEAHGTRTFGGMVSLELEAQRLEQKAAALEAGGK